MPQWHAASLDCVDAAYHRAARLKIQRKEQAPGHSVKKSPDRSRSALPRESDPGQRQALPAKPRFRFRANERSEIWRDPVTTLHAGIQFL